METLQLSIIITTVSYYHEISKWLRVSCHQYALRFAYTYTIKQYRHTSIYCTSLFCSSQIFRFLQIEGLWQPWVEQVYRRHIFNSTCSLRVSVSHSGNSRNISNFLIIFISVMVICDQWSLMYYCNCFGVARPVCSDCSAHWPFSRLSPSPRASIVPETQQYSNQAN
jgi:hypothetical protein